MHEQWREENKRCGVEESDSEIQIVISPGGRVEVENKSRQADRREVECVWRPSALLEKYKEADEQINDADQVDVQDARRPLMNPADAVEVGPIFLRFRSVRRPLHQVMQLAVDPCLLEINLHV